MKIADLLTDSRLPWFKTAYELACEAHEKDVRKDGKPYMTHVDAVILGSVRRMENKISFRKMGVVWEDVLDQNGEMFIDTVLSVAALHDAFEDHPDTHSLVYIGKRFEYYHPDMGDYDKIAILSGIDAISKKPKGTEDYVSYLRRVWYNPHARIVKIADLEHNMSDLKPGNLLDKYTLTYHVLTGNTIFS